MCKREFFSFSKTITSVILSFNIISTYFYLHQKALHMSSFNNPENISIKFNKNQKVNFFFSKLQPKMIKK